MAGSLSPSSDVTRVESGSPKWVSDRTATCITTEARGFQ
jgi:hypothetical protein